MILKGYIYGIGYALACLLISFVLYKLGVKKKYTRKVVHVLVGFEWVILYRFMGAGIHFLTVCLLFLLLLTVAYKGRLMPMIASDADNAPGTVYYAVAMTGVSFVGCFVPEIMLPFGIGVMCTSLGDGLAGAVGQLVTKYNPKIFGNKSLYGSLTNFIISALFAYLISSAYSVELGAINCIMIGILSMELEIVTPYGLDNISVTWGTTAFAYSLMYFAWIGDYILPILLSPVIIIFALSKKALTKGGILAAIILDVVVSCAFRNRGFVILCAFFIGAIVVDKIKNKYKNNGRNEYRTNHECRNYMQVFVNGVVAFVFSVAFLVTKNSVFIVPFVASLAEAFSDTAASGIGAFSNTVYDPFRRRRCESGLSGGMTVVGTVASIVAAFVIAFLAYLLRFSNFGFRELLIVATSAFLGSVIDSCLGSLLQVKYKCPVCGAVTEKEEHCGIDTLKCAGVSFIDNDIVNLLSCAFSAVLATVLTVCV